MLEIASRRKGLVLGDRFDLQPSKFIGMLWSSVRPAKLICAPDDGASADEMALPAPGEVDYRISFADMNRSGFGTA